jgi:hypothetical protein
MMTRFPFRQWDYLPGLLCYVEELGAPDVTRVTRHLLDHCKEHGWPCELDVPTIAKALKVTQLRVGNALADMAEFGIADVDGYTGTVAFNWRALRNMEARERRRA